MKKFMDENFLLNNDTAINLFNNFAKNQPIIDFHNHLSAKEIYEDISYSDIASAWLEKDHYKWRAMRSYGISDDLITGNANNYDKFMAYADTIENSIGNPLYHWTHLELQRYFGITKALSKDTANEIWTICNEKLKTKEFSVRNLLKMQNVKVICTTNDPIEDLKYHKLLAKENFEIQVLPTFRPEKAIGIEKDNFIDYINSLSNITNIKINSIDDLILALKDRLEYFINCGCKLTDHSLENSFFEYTGKNEVNSIFKNRMLGLKLNEEECAKFHGYLLSELGKEYHKHKLSMQLHIGAIRNNSKRMYNILGVDSGFDSINDFNYAKMLSNLLNDMDKTNELPKVILYCLNQNDFNILAAMAGNFQSNDENIKGKIQLGSAWWFCDNKLGMENHFDSLANAGLISTFIGMLTDSRSYLSFPRHEYFRRIICNKIGNLVENGEYPNNIEYLGKMVNDICCFNAVNYFGFTI